MTVEALKSEDLTRFVVPAAKGVSHLTTFRVTQEQARVSRMD